MKFALGMVRFICYWATVLLGNASMDKWILMKHSCSVVVYAMGEYWNITFV